MGTAKTSVHGPNERASNGDIESLLMCRGTPNIRTEHNRTMQVNTTTILKQKASPPKSLRASTDASINNRANIISKLNYQRKM